MSRSETFRAGVGAVVRHGTGLVLAFERASRPGSWQLPQGGVDIGEDVEAAMWRELWEETGLRSDAVTLIGPIPVWMGYELPEQYRSSETRRGQVHRWFVLQCESLTPPIDLDASDAPEFTAWQWMTIDALIAAAIEFRRPVYRALATYLR